MEPESLPYQRRQMFAEQFCPTILHSLLHTWTNEYFLAKPFRFLHLSRFAMMILALLLCTCAAGTSPLAFERRTTSTKIEYKHMLGFSGLLISLENYISFLAEKQDNTTMMSGTNHSHFNLADDAVGKDVNSDTEEIFLSDSWNESNLSNYSISLHSTSPNTPNYRLFHSHTPPLPESPTPTPHHPPIHPTSPSESIQRRPPFRGSRGHDHA